MLITRRSWVRPPCGPIAFHSTLGPMWQVGQDKQCSLSELVLIQVGSNGQQRGHFALWPLLLIYPSCTVCFVRNKCCTLCKALNWVCIQGNTCLGHMKQSRTVVIPLQSYTLKETILLCQNTVAPTSELLSLSNRQNVMIFIYVVDLAKYNACNK